MSEKVASKLENVLLGLLICSASRSIFDLELWKIKFGNYGLVVGIHLQIASRMYFCIPKDLIFRGVLHFRTPKIPIF